MREMGDIVVARREWRGSGKARTKPASAICVGVSLRVERGIPGTKRDGAETVAKLAKRHDTPECCYLRINALP